MYVFSRYCACVCVYIYIYNQKYFHRSVYLCVCVCVCVCVFMFIYICIYIWNWNYFQASVCVCVCVCVYIYIYIYMLTHSLLVKFVICVRVCVSEIGIIFKFLCACIYARDVQNILSINQKDKPKLNIFINTYTSYKTRKTNLDFCLNFCLSKAYTKVKGARQI